MRICRFNEGSIGVVEDDKVFDVSDCLKIAHVGTYPQPRHDLFVEALPEMRNAILERLASATVYPLADVKLLSPIANPGKIVCAPLNYDFHVAEAKSDSGINFGTAITDSKSIGAFLKASSALVGPSQGVAIRFPDRRHDHEIELVAIIGTIADRVAPAEALAHVAGYSVGLDMTMRGTEDRSLRKSIDSYAVLGPWLVTADDVDVTKLALRLSVNGEERQADNTANMVVPVAEFISFISHHFTLFPGDLIYTGTPAGVGPVRHGDVISAEIEGIGVMDVNVRLA